MYQSLINRIFPLNRAGLIALAVITATPSFILGLMLHASIVGMLAGIACFTLLLLKLWPKLETALLPYALWTQSLRFAVALRVVLSLAAMCAYMEFVFHVYRPLFQWALIPDMLSGIGVIELLSGSGRDWDKVSTQIYASFAPAFTATVLQGIMVLAVTLSTTLPAAPVAWLYQKLKQFKAGFYR